MLLLPSHFVSGLFVDVLVAFFFYCCSAWAVLFGFVADELRITHANAHDAMELTSDVVLDELIGQGTDIQPTD